MMFHVNLQGCIKKNNWWFGAQWFGIRIGVAKSSNNHFHKGIPRNPIHRASNHQAKPLDDNYTSIGNITPLTKGSGPYTYTSYKVGGYNML